MHRESLRRHIRESLRRELVRPFWFVRQKSAREGCQVRTSAGSEKRQRERTVESPLVCALPFSSSRGCLCRKSADCNISVSLQQVRRRDSSTRVAMVSLPSVHWCISWLQGTVGFEGSGSETSLVVFSCCCRCLCVCLGFSNCKAQQNRNGRCVNEEASSRRGTASA
jgi:hypothetical protein